MPLQIRRGTDIERQSMTPAEGELIFVTNTNRLFVGNGSTPGGIVITGYTNNDAQDAAAAIFTANNPAHSSIGFTYNTSTNLITAAVDLSDYQGVIQADAFKGSVFSDDSSLLLDSVTGRFNLNGTINTHTIPDTSSLLDLGSSSLRWRNLFIGGTIFVDGAINANLINADIITANAITGNFSGSVFSDASTLLVDAVAGTIPAAVVSGTFTGVHVGDVTGSVFADNAVKLIDAVNGTVELDGTISGDIIPTANEVYDIGAANLRFRDLYLSGSSIELGAATITAAGSAVNLPAGSTVGGEIIGTGGGNDDYRGNIIGDDSAILVNTSDNTVTANFVTALQGFNGNLIGAVTGNVTGNVTGILYGVVLGSVVGNVIGNVTGNSAGFHTGDVKGSVFGDDSSVLVDGVNSSINLNGTVKGDIIPDANIAYDIGSPTNRFRDIYLSGNTIDLGGVTISTTDDGYVSLPGVTQTRFKPGSISDTRQSGEIFYNNDAISENAVIIDGATFSWAQDNPIPPAAYPGTFEPSVYSATFNGGIFQTFVVTSVANPGTPPPNNIYQIDAVNYPVLNLVRGGVYTFDQSAASNNTHQIAFKDGAGNPYTQGVVSTGVPGTAGAQTVFTVPANAPDDLRYYCVQHGNGMGNVITVQSSNGISQTLTVISVPNPEGAGAIYQIDGVNKPVLTLVRGGVYTFDQSDPSNVTHQIAFKDSTGASYVTGVVTTGSVGQAGAQTVITVAANAPDDLRYYCVTHGNNMGNVITVQSPSGFITAISLVQANYYDDTQNWVTGNGDNMFALSPGTVLTRQSIYDDIVANQGPLAVLAAAIVSTSESAPTLNVPTDISDLTDTTGLIPSNVSDLTNDLGYITANSNIVGDLRGSVFADDSTMLIDSTGGGTITAPSVTISNFLQLPVFVDDAARLSAIPIAVQGMVIMMRAGTLPPATNQLQFYNGFDWVAL